MTALPPSTDFTNSSVTEGQFKTAMTYLRDYLASLLGTDGTLATALGALGISFNSVSSKSANYTVIASDRGKTIHCTATLELALTEAATLGSSFSCQINNVGSGTVTINPNGTELIDGQSTKTISANQSAIIYCDGTNFYSVGLSSAGGLLGIKYYTTAGTHSYTATAGTNYIEVEVIGGGGGGRCGSTNSPPSGSTGGTSSFGAFVSATGGMGGKTSSGNSGGIGSGGDINATGCNGNNVGQGLGGGYARKKITSGFSGTTITVGNGGAGGVLGGSVADDARGIGGTSFFGGSQFGAAGLSGGGGSGGNNSAGYAGGAGVVIVYEYA